MSSFSRTDIFSTHLMLFYIYSLLPAITAVLTTTFLLTTNQQKKEKRAIEASASYTALMYPSNGYPTALEVF